MTEQVELCSLLSPLTDLVESSLRGEDGDVAVKACAGPPGHDGWK